MENLEQNAGRSRASKGVHENLDRAHSKDIESFSSSFLEDPAAFLILQLVQLIDFKKVSDIKSYLSATPELADLVEPVLHRMEEAEMIEVRGDEIICPRRFVDFGSEPEAQLQYLPNLFKIAARRVLKNELENPELRKEQREMVRWITLPDSPEIAAEARQIDLEYKAKLFALQEKSFNDPNSIANGVRFMGIVDCVIDPEDFE